MLTSKYREDRINDFLGYCEHITAVFLLVSPAKVGEMNNA